MDAAVVWTAVGALGTLGAAGVAAWAALQSRKSAWEANAAAGTLATIERDRRHDELAPVFDLTLTETGDHVDLKVTLAGGRLERLDAVTLTILDETGEGHWTRGLPSGVSQEEAEAFVWGPWEFNTGASAQVISNRETRPRPYSRASGKNWDLLGLRRTQPGHWMSAMSQERWRRDYAGQPVRLLLTCRREGYEPWTLLYEVVAGQAGALERQQADEISMLPWTIDGAQALVLSDDATEPVHMLVVTNGSKRPIRNVVAKIEATPVGATAKHNKLADNTGEVIAVQIASAVKADTFKPGEHGSKIAVLRGGQRAAFVWNFTVTRYPNPSFTLRFTDDNDLDWEIDKDLRLAKLPNRKGW